MMHLPPQSALYKEFVNSLIRQMVTWPLKTLSEKSGYNVIVYSSVLVEVGTSNCSKRKTCDDAIAHMFKNLLDVRREVETALLQVSTAINHGHGWVEIFGRAVVTNEADEKGFDDIFNAGRGVASQLFEKIDNVLEARPITNTQGSTMVQELHSAEDQDFMDYLERYRKLIRW